MARRKNAQFTLNQTYGSGHGDKTLLAEFYARLNVLYQGDAPIPLPPLENVYPTYDLPGQATIIANHVVRKIAPIGLHNAGLDAEAAKLGELTSCIGRTAVQVTRAVARACAAAADAAAHEKHTQLGKSVLSSKFIASRSYAAYTADAAFTVADHATHIVNAPKVHADAPFFLGEAAANLVFSVAPVNEPTLESSSRRWQSVNDMLAALCEEPDQPDQPAHAVERKPAAKPQIVTTSFGNIDFGKLDFTKLKF